MFKEHPDANGFLTYAGFNPIILLNKIEQVKDL
jgi:hypothetical protein